MAEAPSGPATRDERQKNGSEQDEQNNDIEI
jgi:hypothetical protein